VLEPSITIDPVNGVLLAAALVADVGAPLPAVDGEDDAPPLEQAAKAKVAAAANAARRLGVGILTLFDPP
jgi:hypothetical protein